MFRDEFPHVGIRGDCFSDRGQQGSGERKELPSPFLEEPLQPVGTKCQQQNRRQHEAEPCRPGLHGPPCLPQKIPGKQVSRRPQDGACDVPQGEPFRLHPGKPGDKGNDGPDQADEPPEENAFPSVAREKLLPLLQEPRLEDPVSLPEADMASPAHPEADAVAENGPRGSEPDQVADVEIPLCRQGAGEHDEQGAGHHDPDEGQGLQEGKQEHDPVAQHPEMFDGGQEGMDKIHAAIP